ncbi:DUF3572 domain-containing protein [Roseomonas aeriglobus]|nr:DUF3572 domain-containing protein [Roseomonas aeriglobus]
MQSHETNDDTLALRALVWTLEEPSRAARLLDLTGLDPQALRTSAGSPATLAAVLQFLENHESDLIACAGALNCTPTDLVRIRERLERA